MDCESTRKYVVSLADRHTHELGFLPMQVIHQLIEAKQIILAQANTDPVGYIIRSKFKPRLKIYQTCIQTDARRATFGSETLARVIEDANRNHVRLISLHCASDLESNLFWQANHFEAAGKRTKKTKSRREQIRWELKLPAWHEHWQKLDNDGLETVREKQIKMLVSMGASQEQASRFQRRRYA